MNLLEDSNAVAYTYCSALPARAQLPDTFVGDPPSPNPCLTCCDSGKRCLCYFEHVRD